MANRTHGVPESTVLSIIQAWIKGNSTQDLVGPTVNANVGLAGTGNNKLVTLSGLTAPRVVTLPGANLGTTPPPPQPGQQIIIANNDGTASATNTITVNAGLLSIGTVGNHSIVLNAPYQGVFLEWDGTIWLVAYFSSAGPGVQSVTGGTGIAITGTPTNPIINSTGSGLLDWAQFYSVVPSQTTAPGANFAFPSVGPAKPGTGITALTAATFQLAVAGYYEVAYQYTDASGATQVQLTLNGVAVPWSVIGGATGTTQKFGKVIILTSAANTVLALQNPPGNANTITTPPPDGTETHQNAATLTIDRLA
jgi:hypothetical protein